MKTKILTLLMLFSITVIKAQTVADLFKKSNYEYYWFGVDYSDVRLIGDFYSNSFGGKEPHEAIRDSYFMAWNNLIKDERTKFSVEKMFREDNVIYETSVLDTLNAHTATATLTAPYKMLKPDDIQKRVNDYNFSQQSGVGILFMAEYLNKSSQQAAYQVVVFNIKTKEVLLTQKYVTRPGGFGIRNYWAGSIYHVFDLATKKDYKKWKKEYSN